MEVAKHKSRIKWCISQTEQRLVILPDMTYIGGWTYERDESKMGLHGPHATEI